MVAIIFLFVTAFGLIGFIIKGVELREQQKAEEEKKAEERRKAEQKQKQQEYEKECYSLFCKNIDSYKKYDSNQTEVFFHKLALQERDYNSNRKEAFSDRLERNFYRGRKYYMQRRVLIAETRQKYASLDPKSKRLKMMGDIADAWSVELSKPRPNYSNAYALAAKNTKDWAVAGGLAEGIAGPVAGIATALNVQRENQKIEAYNDNLMNTVVALENAASDKRYNREKECQKVKQCVAKDSCLINVEKDEWSLFNNFLKIKFVECHIIDNKICIGVCIEPNTNPKYNDLSVYSYKIGDKSNNNYTIDGTLLAEVYSSGEEIGSCRLVFPVNGMAMHEYNKISLSGVVDASKVDINNIQSVKVRISPVHLIAIEGEYYNPLYLDSLNLEVLDDSKDELYDCSTLKCTCVKEYKEDSDTKEFRIKHAEEERRKAEEERRKAEEKRRKAEEESRKAEEESRKAEEERRIEYEEALKYTHLEAEYCRYLDRWQLWSWERLTKEEQKIKVYEWAKENEKIKEEYLENADSLEKERLLSLSEYRQALFLRDWFEKKRRDEEAKAKRRIAREERKRKEEAALKALTEERKNREVVRNKIINSSVSVLDIVSLNDIKKGQSINMGHYGQYEVLTWRVIDIKNGKVLLLSDVAFEMKPYHEKSNKSIWKSSSLRSWLKEEFLNNSFSEEELSMIVTTRLVNDESEDEQNTDDKVFLLSQKEVLNYFNSNDELMCMDEKYDYVSWWLRTPGDYSKIALYVDDSGEINDVGLIKTSSNGVRPAMWIKPIKYN